MSNESIQFLEQAEKALEEKNFGSALELVNKSIETDSNDSNAYLLKGIIYAHTEQAALANTAFEKAIELDSQNANAYANYAMHLYQTKNSEKALQMVQAALQIDPENQTAKEVQNLIPQEKAVTPDQILSPLAKSPEQEHRVKFVGQLGKNWVKIAWGIVILGLLLIIATTLMSMPIIQKLTASGKEALNQKLFIKNLQHTYGIWFTSVEIIDPIARVAAFLWAITDIYDRKQKGMYWLWAVVVFFLNYLGLLIYLLFGRKTKAQKTS